MAGVLDSVNRRTQLVGQNRLELLLFRLDGRQLYGINVFKVREVLNCPPLSSLPRSNPLVRGVAHIRGSTIPIIDLSRAIGQRPAEELEQKFIIITEYNLKVQAFLVSAVERIVNMMWEEVHPPPSGAGNQNYLTAVTEVDQQLVEIIDVEKILSEVAPRSEAITLTGIDDALIAQGGQAHVLVVDDSRIARKQVLNCLASVGIEATSCQNGKEALEFLKRLADEGQDPARKFLMVISDIEMPEMDGYTLATEIRADARLKDLHVLLHTSLSGVFNKAMVDKVGADNFIAKFQPDELTQAVIDRLKAVHPAVHSTAA